MLMPNPLRDFVIFLTASGSEGSPSVNVKKISGLFDCSIGNILSYTSASGVDPLATICANRFAVILFHLTFSCFIDQQTTDLF